MAKLYFRYGAMNSGKTTALMQVAFNYEERGMGIVLLKRSQSYFQRPHGQWRIRIQR